MNEDWKYGDILRRAVTKNPAQYTRVMYLGPSMATGRASTGYFIGVQLTEPPPPAVGEWMNPPPIGALRKGLRRSLFERDPDAG